MNYEVLLVPGEKMRALRPAAFILLSFVALTIRTGLQHRHMRSSEARLLLAQNVTSPQAAPVQPEAAPKQSTQQSDAGKGQRAQKDGSQKAERNTQSVNPHAAGPQSDDPGAPPTTLPWLGAPPQFQRTWPPAALPQSDADDDDLLLMDAPSKPPKVHKA